MPSAGIIRSSPYFPR